MNLWDYTHGVGFTLGNSLFGTVKLTKNADFDKYKYSGYGIGFEAQRNLSLSHGSGFGKNVLFDADMSSSVQTDNKKKDIWLLGKGITNGLDYTTLTAGKENCINFT